MRNLIAISCVLFTAACGDNIDNNRPDATPDVDGPIADAMIDTPIDTPMSSFTTPTPIAVPISTAGPDQLMSVKPGPSGSFYAAGFAAATAAGPKAIIVVKLTSAGALDTTFGTAGTGIVTLASVTPTGSSDEIDVAVQSDGKILVSFNVLNANDATDRDVAVARITAAGALDTDFGTTGVATINFSDKGATTFIDNARGLAVDNNNNVFVHAVAKGPAGTPASSDFALAKLNADGKLCDGTNGTTGWGAADSGKFFVDNVIAGTSFNATVRGVATLADGSVIAGGYVGGTPLASGNVVVWYKVDASGDLVTAFGGAGTGVFFDAVLSRQTEVYNLALNDAGTKVTTAGYGNVLGVDRDDWISLQIDVTTGLLTPTWGGSTNGAKVFDVSPNMTSSNCRNAIALPDGKTLMIGSTGGGNTPAQDATFAVLDASGNLDTEYATGIHRIKLASADDKNDQFWGGAVSGTKVMIAGWRGTATNPVMQTDVLNDDSYVVIFDVQ